MVKNEYYEIEYDQVKNRVYFKIKGFWESVDVVPNFEKDWMNTIVNAKNGFTICADLLDMKPFPKDVEQLNAQVQQKLMEKGLRKVGQVAPVVVAGQVNNLSRKSGLRDVLRAFYTLEQAEYWLDK
ncbi:MAG: hypothetical protein ACXADA_03450 [Candidatus Hodarchaeales archaeon]|jgi:uncharacterized protein (UPF0297 family)